MLFWFFAILGRVIASRNATVVYISAGFMHRTNDKGDILWIYLPSESLRD